MNSVRALVVPFLSAFALFAACSSNNTTVSETPPPDTGDDGGGGPGDDGGTSPGKADADAATGPTEDILVEDTRPASPPLSCADFCKADGYTCVTSCSLGEDAGTGAGDALYGDSFSGVVSQRLASCTDAPAASQGGKNLNVYDCCCRSPKHQKITGPMPPQSCTAVCSAHKLKCDEFTIWDGADTTTYQGGGHASYDDGGATSFANFGCDSVAPATHKNGTLVGYECGCF
jgi:hypothetical protein